MSDFLGPADVARVLGVSSERVRSLVYEGKLVEAGRTSLGRVFLAEDVEALRLKREALRDARAREELRDARAREADAERESCHSGDIEAS